MNQWLFFHLVVALIVAILFLTAMERDTSLKLNVLGGTIETEPRSSAIER